MKARLPQGFGGKGAGGDMRQIAAQAQKLQQQMDVAKSELENKEYKSSAGGGVVEVIATGKMEVKSITLKQEIIDPDEPDMLTDLIIAAVNEALRTANEEKEQVMDSLSGGLNIPGLF